jgi:hypothetical protein
VIRQGPACLGRLGKSARRYGPAVLSRRTSKASLLILVGSDWGRVGDDMELLFSAGARTEPGQLILVSSDWRGVRDDMDLQAHTSRD